MMVRKAIRPSPWWWRLSIGPCLFSLGCYVVVAVNLALKMSAGVSFINAISLPIASVGFISAVIGALIGIVNIKKQNQFIQDRKNELALLKAERDELKAEKEIADQEFRETQYGVHYNLGQAVAVNSSYRNLIRVLKGEISHKPPMQEVEPLDFSRITDPAEDLDGSIIETKEALRQTDIELEGVRKMKEIIKELHVDENHPYYEHARGYSS